MPYLVGEDPDEVFGSVRTIPPGTIGEDPDEVFTPQEAPTAGEDPAQVFGELPTTPAPVAPTPATPEPLAEELPTSTEGKWVSPAPASQQPREDLIAGTSYDKGKGWEPVPQDEATQAKFREELEGTKERQRVRDAEAIKRLEEYAGYTGQSVASRLLFTSTESANDAIAKLADAVTFGGATRLVLGEEGERNFHKRIAERASKRAALNQVVAHHSQGLFSEGALRFGLTAADAGGDVAGTTILPGLALGKYIAPLVRGGEAIAPSALSYFNMTISQYPQHLDKARQEGLGPIASNIYAGTQTLAEVGSEVAGGKVASKFETKTIEQILNPSKTLKLTDHLLGMGIDGASEAVTSVAQGIVDVLSAVDSEAMENWGSEALEAFGIGAVLRASLGAVDMLNNAEAEARARALVDDFMEDPSQLNAERLGIPDEIAADAEARQQVVAAVNQADVIISETEAGQEYAEQNPASEEAAAAIQQESEVDSRLQQMYEEGQTSEPEFEDLLARKRELEAERLTPPAPKADFSIEGQEVDHLANISEQLEQVKAERDSLFEANKEERNRIDSELAEILRQQKTMDSDDPGATELNAKKTQLWQRLTQIDDESARVASQLVQLEMEQAAAEGKSISEFNNTTPVEYYANNPVVNEFLRDKTNNPAVAKEVLALRKDLENYPTFKGETYRGMAFETQEQLEAYLGTLAPGSIVSDKGFVSTSQNEAIADEFKERQGKHPIKLVIEGESGRELSKGQIKDENVRLLMESESEVLFKNNTKFKVDSISGEGGIPVVHLTEYTGQGTPTQVRFDVGFQQESPQQEPPQQEPPKPKTPPSDSEPLPPGIRLAEASMAQTARELGRGESYYSPNRKTLRQEANRAIQAGLVDKVPDIATTIVEEPRAFSTLEDAAFLEWVGLTSKRVLALREQIDANAAAGIVDSTVVAEHTRLTEEFDRVRLAIQLANTEWGRSGAFKKHSLNSDNDLAIVLSRMQVNKGAPLTPEEKADIERAVIELDKAAEDVEALEAKRNLEIADKVIEEASQGVAESQELQDDLIQRVKKMLDEGCGLE